MTVQFATNAELAVRLGLTFTQAEQTRADTLLQLASGLIQDETKQTIALVSNDNLTLPSTFEDRVRLPERPVVSVASVSIDGVALQSPLEYYLEADSLVRANWSMLAERHFFASAGGWGGPLRALSIVYTHGYSVIPPVVKAVCMEAVVRVWVNPGAVIEERVGNVMTMYSMRSGTETPTGLLLTDGEVKKLNDTLRRQSGTVGLR